MKVGKVVRHVAIMQRRVLLLHFTYVSRGGTSLAEVDTSDGKSRCS
jgi:hypothetical protein